MSLVDLFDNFAAKPVTCTWVINEFMEKSSEFSPETKLSTGAFCLELREDDDASIISFVALGNIPEFYYRISVIDNEGQKWNTKEGPGECFEYDICHYYLVDEADDILSDGKLTICCEIFEHSNDPGVVRCLNNLVSLSQNNQSLLDSGKLSDVALVVGEREFKAHKSILSSRSVVFEKMFEHDLEESKRNRVVIEDMSDGAAEELLKFIYTGKVKDLDEHVHELYAAADKYQIDSLKSYCELYLSMSLSVSTVPKTRQLAELYSLGDLKSKCLDYITRNWAEFKLEDWKDLTTSRPELGYQLFQILGSKQVK